MFSCRNSKIKLMLNATALWINPYICIPTIHVQIMLKRGKSESELLSIILTGRGKMSFHQRSFLTFFVNCWIDPFKG